MPEDRFWNGNYPESYVRGKLDDLERERPEVDPLGPEAILVSLGADAHYADPLGGLTLSSRAFVETYLVAHELARVVDVARVFPERRERLEADHLLAPLHADRVAV